MPGDKDSYVKAMLSAEYLRKTGYFNEKKVGQVFAKFKNGSGAVANENQNMALTGILSTQLLHYHFIDDFKMAVEGYLQPDKIVRNDKI